MCVFLRCKLLAFFFHVDMFMMRVLCVEWERAWDTKSKGVWDVMSFSCVCMIAVISHLLCGCSYLRNVRVCR